MSEEREIPIGWVIASVQEIAEVIMGQSPPSSTYNKDEIGLPFFQGKGEFTELHPVAEKWCSKPNKIAINNDILISVRAPVGATNIADRECCIGRGLAAIRYYHDHKFIYYYFRLIEKELDEKGTGTTFRAISGDVIRSTKLFLPPLPEQHRIVAKIEELFSSLDKGIESLKTAQQQLKVYRQAVLKWAFEGKLTNKNVVDGELPEGWKYLKLRDITTEKDGLRRGPFGSSIKKEFFVPYGYKVYEQGNAIYDDPYRGNYYIDEKKYSELENFKTMAGDLIVSCSGTLGKISEIPNNAQPGVINQALLRIRLKHDLVSNKFFIFYFRSDFFQKGIIDQSQGTAMTNLVGIKDFKEIELLIPPLQEQYVIVSEIESRLSVCDKIEEIIEHSLKQSEALRQSILKKAFEGKLVPQDPNDEPATKLLERIRTARQKQAP